MAISTSTGTFRPIHSYAPTQDRGGIEKSTRGHTVHRIDLKFSKINETDYIKWCRRNLGERGLEWDFWLVGGVLYIEVKTEKAKFTYEMWKL